MPWRRSPTAPRVLVERWVFLASIVGGISALVAGQKPIEIAMTVLAVHAALATSVIASVASVDVARGVLLALRRGITFRSADAWDRAGRVAVAMFCARGTLLLGEPELAELEPVSPKHTPNDVLALAAGAGVTEVFPNCPRYVHKMQLVERSPFVPKEGTKAPIRNWKRRDWAKDVCRRATLHVRSSG